MPSRPAIASLGDVESIEQIPLAQRHLPNSTYELIRRTARAHGTATAIELLPTVDSTTTIQVSYAEFLAAINRTGHLLRRLGVTTKTAVTLLLPNLPQGHFAIWAAQAVGIANPVNPLFKASQIASIMRSANTRVLVSLGPGSPGELWKKACDAVKEAPAVTTVLAVDLHAALGGDCGDFHGARGGDVHAARGGDVHAARGGDVHAARGGDVQAHLEAARADLPPHVQLLDFDRAIAAEPSTDLLSEADLQRDHVVAYLNTGGTTGAPKIAQWKDASQVYNAWAISLLRDFSVGDAMLSGLPLFHANAIMATGLSIFACGAKLVQLTPDGYRNPGVIPRLWEFVQRFRASGFGGVPTVYAALLEQLKPQHDIGSLRLCGCGAAPMPAELFRKFKAATGIEIFEGYGLTEATCASTANPPEGERRVGSVGIRFPYQKVRTVMLNDADRVERECGVDETGVVLIGGPSVFAGYKDQPELTAKTFAEPGWLNTGDLGRFDAQGYLWLAGRAKDLIIRGGHNIDPAMIENALMSHPDVALAAAIGECDAYAGEVPVAYVKLRPGAHASADDIKAFARTAIPESGAAPTRVEIVGDLPLTPVGKIFKPILRERSAVHVARLALAAAGVAAEVNAFTDPNKGLCVAVKMLDGSHADAARAALGKFTFNTVLAQ